MGIKKQWVCKCDFDNVYNINYELLNKTKDNTENDLYDACRFANNECNELGNETWDLITLKNLKNRLKKYGSSFNNKWFFCAFHTDFINQVNNFDKNILIDTRTKTKKTTKTK